VKGRAKILKSKVLYTGMVFRLQRDTVIEPGGVRADRDIIVHPGSVVVLPIFEDGRVLLIRQYRHTVGDFLWNLWPGARSRAKHRAPRRGGNCLRKRDTRRGVCGNCLHIIPTPVSCRSGCGFCGGGLAEGPRIQKKTRRSLRENSR